MARAGMSVPPMAGQGRVHQRPAEQKQQVEERQHQRGAGCNVRFSHCRCTLQVHLRRRYWRQAPGANTPFLSSRRLTTTAISSASMGVVPSVTTLRLLFACWTDLSDMEMAPQRCASDMEIPRVPEGAMIPPATMVSSFAATLC